MSEHDRMRPGCSGRWVSGTGGHRIHEPCARRADYFDDDDAFAYCAEHCPEQDRNGFSCVSREVVQAEREELAEWRSGKRRVFWRVRKPGKTRDFSAPRKAWNWWATGFAWGSGKDDTVLGITRVTVRPKRKSLPNALRTAAQCGKSGIVAEAMKGAK